MQAPQTEVLIRAADGTELLRSVLVPGDYVLGRAPECELRFEADQVSRRHARLTINFDHALIEDLGSTHGTQVNGKRVNETMRLWPGQKIQLGAATVELRRQKTLSPDFSLAPNVAITREILPEELLRDRRYDIGGVVAQGGMGAILQAKEASIERSVAMKVMLDGSSPDALVRFIAEARVTGQLEHPNIVPVHELGVDENDQVFYTMKFVQGVTLKKVLERLADGDAAMLAKYPLGTLLTIFQKVCDAVAFAHSKGVIHRDLKPDNIMLGDYGEVLLMDWGLAKILGKDEGGRRKDEGACQSPSSFILHPSSLHGTLGGTILGTPQYMAPEQARGEVETLDERADIYALGAILYHVLALRPSVTGDDPYAVVEKVARGDIESLSGREGSPSVPKLPGNGGGKSQGTLGEAALPHLRSGRAPDSLVAVVRKAMAFDRTQRYASVADLQTDLTAYQNGFATSAERAGLAKQVVLLVRRHRGIFSTAAAAWLLITALGVWFIINLRAKEHRALEGEQTALVEKESARRALALSQEALAEAAFRSADLPAMVQALDSVPPDLRDQRWDYLSAKRDTSLGEFRVEGLGRWRALVAIPGRAAQFAIADNSGVIGIVDVKTRQLLRRIVTELRGESLLAVAGDGSRLAVTQRGASAIHLYRVTDGTLERTVPAPGRDIRRLSLSADGNVLAVFNKVEKRGGLYLLNARDGAVRWKLPGDSLYIVDAIFSPDGTRLFAGLGRELQVIDVATGEVIRKQPVYINSMALSRDGRRLALGLHSGEVALIDTATGLETQRVRLHLSMITGLSWTAGNQLISVGAQRESDRGRLVMRLWETEGFLGRGTFFGLAEGLVAAGWDFDPESGYLLVNQNLPRLWHIPAGIEAARFSGGNSERGWGTGFISDTVLLARRDFTLASFDVTNPHAPKELPQSGPRTYLVVAPFWPGGMVALAQRTGEPPRSIKLYRTDGGRLVETLDVPTPERTLQMDWDAAGAEIVAVEYTHGAFILDARTGATRLRLQQPIKQAVFAGTGGHVVAIVSRKSEADDVQDDLTRLDAQTGQPLHSVPYHQRLNALAASPDRRLVAIGCADMAVRVLDADTLEERFAFRAHDAEITAVAFHPKLPIVATGSADGSVKLWDYERAHLRRAFLGLTGTPVMLAFSPNGRLLSAEGEERTARLFDLGED